MYRDHPLGEIIQWPGGYAMTLGRYVCGWAIRCCEGHETPTDAKHHGLARLIETAAHVADEDINAWSAKESAA